MAANEAMNEVDALKQQEILNQNKYNEDQINRNTLDNSDNAEERIRVDRRKLELLLQGFYSPYFRCFEYTIFRIDFLNCKLQGSVKILP